jgi:outer membrane protein OmpA-like peptidoglycan-associated protein
MKRGALVIGLIFVITSSIQSQSISSTTEIKADKYLAKRDYVKAARLYQQLQDEAPQERILLKLARLYYQIGSMPVAYQHYQQVIDKKYLTVSEDFLRFAELSTIMNKPEQALYWVNQFLDRNPRNEAAQNLLFQLQSSRQDFLTMELEPEAEEEPLMEGTLLTLKSAQDSQVYVLTEKRVIEVMSLSANGHYQWLEQLLLENNIKITNTVSLNPILYEPDQVSMDETYQQELDKLAKLMHKYNFIEIEISAHADHNGSDLYNRQISQSRANAARDFLLTRDIQIERLLTVGYGEEDPLFKCHERPCTSDEARLNRRTEFRIVYLNTNQIVTN